MTRPNPVLEQALACAARGWPVFPCQPGRKAPATAHGHLDATTDPAQVTAWFARRPGLNLAVATGQPGPDVLDIDKRPAGTGFAALNQLARAGLLHGAAAWVRTPSGGLHAYFTGTTQRNGHLPGHHLDFRSAGGYVLIPPSHIGGQPYQLLSRTGRTATLDWEHVTTLLGPARPSQAPRPARPGTAPARLAGWLARQPEGNRNAGLFWAACRALEAGQPAALDALAAAARHAGLPDPEIKATLASARRATTPRPAEPEAVTRT